jgi:cytochrome c556
MKYLFPVLVLLVSITACGSDTDTEKKDMGSVQEKHTLHAMSSEKLREIMQDLNLSAYKGGVPDLQDGKMSKEKMAGLIEAVEELLFHAELLSTGQPSVKLKETELATFRAMAGQLYTETLNLQQLTEYNDYHAIEPAYERLNQTCIACHNLFRDK